MLQKNSSTPIYIQLKNIIKREIMSGRLQEDDVIPSETQMAKTYGITRMTVRRAITELVNENLLRREHGRGTFVSLKPIRYNMWNFSGFTSYITKIDKIPVSEILEQGVVVQDDREFFRLERARGVKEDDEIHYLTVDKSLLPLELFPGIMNYDFETLSLYTVIKQEYGIIPDRVEMTIKPQMPDGTICRALKIQPDILLLATRGTVYSRDNREMERIQVIYGPNIDFKLATTIDM